MIEDTIKDLTAAVTALTAALLANATAAPASTEAPKPATKRAAKKAAKVVAPEPDDLDDEEEADDELEEVPTPEPVKPVEKAGKLTLDTIRDEVRNTREHLRNNVSAEAVAEHKIQTQKILKRFDADSVTTLAEKHIPAVLDALRKIDAGTKAVAEDDDL